ncbi:MAG: hypothetical protein ACJA19_001220 [Bacteroidia bacterium]|jgi:hypothetical protein
MFSTVNLYITMFFYLPQRLLQGTLRVLTLDNTKIDLPFDGSPVPNTYFEKLKTDGVTRGN